MKKIMEKISAIGKMSLVFSILSFVVLTITITTCAFISSVMFHLGLLENVRFIWMPFIILGACSILFGVVLSVFLARKPLKPFNILLNGLEELSKGNFKFRMTDLPPHGYGKLLESRFNRLAEELDQTEMLRGDFVNNFSHEFKTPIVSIRGFAKLMQKGKLTQEEQQEYLSIIVEESTRLAEMATNVLSLTKLENQNVLQHVESYNLSEQIRTCILLLEKNWTQKQINIDAEFAEYNITANEEMMKQVWINLLENAVKFCDIEGTVRIDIQEWNEKNPEFDSGSRMDNSMEDRTEKAKSLRVIIENTGSHIQEEDKERIFHKFYQGDTSHSGKGNGIGLAIVKRVLDLHGGSIMVENSDLETRFSVIIG